MARISLFTQKHEEALRYIDKAIQLNPLSPILKDVKLGILINAGKYDMAIATADSMMIMHPDDNRLLWDKAVAYLMKGEYETAITTFLKRSVNAENNFALGYAYALEGNTEEARRILQYLLDRNKKAYVPPAMIGLVYYGLGEMEQVYEYLPKETALYILHLPMFRELRQDPKLRSLFELASIPVG